MFVEMRRKKAQMSKENSDKLLKECDEGVLGTVGTNGYPHTVPLNYVYFSNKIYFHSAKQGLKMSNIMFNPKVSFTVYDNVKIIEDRFSTEYQSVMVYGNAKIIPGNKEILMELIKKYSSNFMKEGFEYVEGSFSSTYLVEITIEHITGKESNKNT